MSRFGNPEPITRERRDGGLGVPGVKGTAGATGATGAAGTNGTNGTPGSDGTTGPPGTDGTPGTPGSDGTPGSPGTPGSKEAVVSTKEGTYAFACVESNQVWFSCITRMSEKLPERFLAAIERSTMISFASEFGSHRITYALRKGFINWNSPDRTEAQKVTNDAFWEKAKGNV